jgi:hypothetical protein
VLPLVWIVTPGVFFGVKNAASFMVKSFSAWFDTYSEVSAVTLLSDLNTDFSKP